MLWALTLHRDNKTTSDFTQPRTKVEQGGGTVEISPFLFFPVESALQRYCTVMSPCGGKTQSRA